MKPTKALAAVLLLLIPVGTTVGKAAELWPSELNTSPQSHEQKIVHVRGWLEYGFELRNLFDAKSDQDASGKLVYDPHCISIEVPERLRPQATKLNQHYVLVTGVFFTDLAGNDVFSGLCNKTGVKIIYLQTSK